MIVPYDSKKSMEDWLAAKEVIKTFLREGDPTVSEEILDHNSSALIARLTHASPILFIVRSDCVAWDGEFKKLPKRKPK